MTSWGKLLKNEFESTGDDFSKIKTTLTVGQLEESFDSGYGGTNGEPFTAWGEKYVYFPICYDGAEWVGSAPRNPCDEKTPHQGGG